MAQLGRGSPASQWLASVQRRVAGELPGARTPRRGANDRHSLLVEFLESVYFAKIVWHLAE